MDQVEFWKITYSLLFLLTLLSSPEQFSVEGAVVNRLGDVVHLDVLSAFQIGDGARHFQRPVIAPARQVELSNGGFEQIFGARVHLAELAHSF